MKITIVFGAFLPVPPIMGGAIEKVWLAMAEEFARNGHEVTLISRAMDGLADAETVNDIRHRRVSGFNSPRSMIWLKFLDLIYSLRVRAMLPPADILVTNTFWLPILVRDVTRGKMYVHVGRYPKGQLRFYSRVARLQTLSRSIARAMIAEAPQLESKVKVLPNPSPEPVSSAPPPPLPDRPSKILFVGRVHPEKGVHLLVEAFAENRNEFPSWELVVVGPWQFDKGGGGESYWRKLQLLAQPAAARIKFRGAIFDPAELEREFRQARLFVYPSLAERGETFGLAALEGMANGCAVLVSELECFKDFITENETGFYFNHRCERPTESLGARMKELLRNDSLLARVAEAGYRKSDEFSLGKVAARFLQDFESIHNAS